MNTPTSTTTPKSSISPAPTLSTQQFLMGLHPGKHIATGTNLLEPCEPFEKLKTVLSMLMTCQDEETQEMRIDKHQLGWALLLLSDLAEEAEKKADAYQEHCYALYREVEKRLNTCHLIAHDRELWGSLATAKEV